LKKYKLDIMDETKIREELAKTVVIKQRELANIN
jgi:hypothetical protein